MRGETYDFGSRDLKYTLLCAAGGAQRSRGCLEAHILEQFVEAPQRDTWLLPG